VLQRFLVMLATIGHNYAPDFDGADPQGVQWDSLESFVSIIGARKVGEMQCFFARAVSAIILYVL